MEKTMSAVSWLALRYHHRQGYLKQEDIKEAKAMELVQRVRDFNAGYNQDKSLENYLKDESNN